MVRPLVLDAVYDLRTPVKQITQGSGEGVSASQTAGRARVMPPPCGPAATMLLATTMQETCRDRAKVTLPAPATGQGRQHARWAMGRAAARTCVYAVWGGPGKRCLRQSTPRRQPCAPAITAACGAALQLGWGAANTMRAPSSARTVFCQNLGVDNHGLLGAGTPSGGLGRSSTWAIWCEGVYLGVQGDRMRWYISVD